MANPCLKLIKGNNALETHFAGIEKLPIEQQREAILNKAKEYHEILYNELEALKITINPNHKVIKFSPDGSVGKNPQQDRPGSGNNNVPERESGEIQTESGEQGVKPEIKLELVSAKDLVQSDDPITNKNTHNDIKERYKLLKSLIDCLFA